MHCPSCNKPLKLDARFCGHCGYQLTQKARSDLKPRDLFSIENSNESTNNEDSSTDNDFFEDSPNPLIQGSDESDDSGWVDDRKVFGEEDDPTVVDDQVKKADKPAKKLDSKIAAKLKAKKRKGPSLIGNILNGTQSFILLCVVSIAPVYIATTLEDKLYLQIFLVLPLLLIFFWPFTRKKGLTLNLIFKLSNLWYCGAIAYLIFLSQKAGLSPHIINQHWNGFLIQIDFWILLHLYFAFFCQSLIFYLWRTRLNWLLKIIPICLMAYCLVELLTQLKTTTTVHNLGHEQNIITATLKPFIGDFALYIAPHFILTHLFLPLTISVLFFISFLLFVQKKWPLSISSLFYGLQGMIFISVYLTPYRNEDISSKIFTLGPLIDQILKTVLESIPIII